MCEPISATTAFWSSMAVAAASAGASYMQGQEQANAQAEYQARLAKENQRAMLQNAEIANKTYVEQAAASNMELMQKQEAASEEVQDLHIEALQKAGTAMASSESAGLSFDSLMADFYRQEARYKDSILHGYEMDSVQNDMQIQGFRREAKNRGTSFQRYTPAPVSSPSLLGAGLSIGASALENYHRFYKDDE
ncbi:hypothetical protein [Maridesulfovibrio sp.]|uniref:virion core protein, T7 gp14 family n=1 Tax=Maridesulfovibrio sp. TaxID=2795000 RepID=UPI002A18BFC4|nr:hypothetical protein [Maridesulfovibrio sp.]